MDLCDWKQEAAIVFVTTIKKFNHHKNVTFGSFYKTNLRNRLYDLLRRKRAKKRIPDRIKASFSAYTEYYAETIQDKNAPNPLSIYEFYETIKAASGLCSEFEKYVLLATLQQKTIKQIAEEKQVSNAKVSSALLRCKRKYQAQSALTSVNINDKVSTIN